MYKYLLFLFGILFIASCAKDENTDNAGFDISGVEKIEARVLETRTIHLLITQKTGDLDNVFLTLENVPKGITYTFGQVAGIPDYGTDLTLTISREVEGGLHTLKLIGRSSTYTKEVAIEVNIDKSLSCTFTVYNSVTYNPENISSNLLDSALVSLYKTDSAFQAKAPDYYNYTDENGKVNFYKLPVGTYLFTIQKDSLSNILQKQNVNGVLKGYVAVGMFRSSGEIINSAQPKAKIGDIKFKDINGDNKIDQNDMAPYDDLSVYDGDVNEKVIWLGR